MSDSTPYQVLARKYRPKSFDEVVGQPGVVTTLRNAISQRRVHHAYLFSGTRGVGKTTLARLFARALNCAQGPTEEPCGRCDACREIAAGSSMDVIEIDGASNRKVEDVDPLREAARYAPARDRHKIFIIDEVHMLSETAFNALLKILEEPPARTIFLFATTEPEQVPDTILSRCLHLACRRVARQEISQALQRTCAAEKIEASTEALDLIAGLAAGSLRDGLSLMDQAIAFSGGDLDAGSVRAALGLIDKGIVLEFIEAIARQDPGAALSVIERLSTAGADLTHFCREAVARLRDVLMCKAAGAEAARSLGLSEEEAVSCDKLAALFSQDGLLRLAQAALDLADRIRRDENPRFLLEASALKMIRLADLTPIEELLRRMGSGSSSTPPGSEALPRKGGARASGPGGAQAGGLLFAPAEAVSLPAPQAPVGTPALSPTSVTGAAPEQVDTSEVHLILEAVSARKVSLSTFLAQARSLKLRSHTLVIAIHQNQGFLRSALEAPDNIGIIREEASKAMGRPIAVRVEAEAPPSDDLAAVAGRGAAGDAPGSKERLMNEALKEPVVRAVMDMFKGQIIDVREGP